MTRATWPLSRDAVEAAARAVAEDHGYHWDRLNAAEQAEMIAHASRYLRSAIAAWEPSREQREALCIALEDKYSPLDEILLAAVRTEVGE